MLSTPVSCLLSFQLSLSFSTLSFFFFVNFLLFILLYYSGVGHVNFSVLLSNRQQAQKNIAAINLYYLNIYSIYEYVHLYRGNLLSSQHVNVCLYMYTLWALMNCWRLEHLVSIHAIRYVSHIAIPGVLLLLKKKEHIGVCHIVCMS